MKLRKTKIVAGFSFHVEPVSNEENRKKYKTVYFLIHTIRDNSEGFIKDPECILFNLVERFREFDK